MKNFINQPFHLVTISPWPIYISFNLLFIMISMLKLFNYSNFYLLLFNIFLLMICSFQWWRDVIRESSFQGFHTIKTISGLKMSMILFIISEIFFFISFFWAYFHMFLSPAIEIGMIWPPFNMNMIILNPYNLPLLNTILLVSSGMFLSMAHYSLIKKMKYMFFIMMILTIMFGIIFSYIQYYEYKLTNFSINSSNYGSTFFLMTGFHGIHVIIGTIFILITFFRQMNFHMTNIHHLGFEMSAWYWHFVDIVWLFLFLFIYWWPF